MKFFAYKNFLFYGNCKSRGGWLCRSKQCTSFFLSLAGHRFDSDNQSVSQCISAGWLCKLQVAFSHHVSDVVKFTSEKATLLHQFTTRSLTVHSHSNNCQLISTSVKLTNVFWFYTAARFFFCKLGTICVAISPPLLYFSWALLSLSVIGRLIIAYSVVVCECNLLTFVLCTKCLVLMLWCPW